VTAQQGEVLAMTGILNESAFPWPHCRLERFPQEFPPEFPASDLQACRSGQARSDVGGPGVFLMQALRVVERTVGQQFGAQAVAVVNGGTGEVRIVPDVDKEGPVVDRGFKYRASLTGQQ